MSADAVCPVVGDLEGAFSDASQMLTLLECLIPAVEQWVAATYADLPPLDGYVYVPSGVTRQGLGCPFDDDSLQYCPGDNTIYVGESASWELYTTSGDAALAVVLAHETTHRFQAAAGMDTGYDGRRQIPFEDQADCGAGVFMAFSVAQGWAVPDDQEDAKSALIAAGSAEGPHRNHGTASERVDAYERGFTSTDPVPLRACNAFVPNIPLIS